MRHAPAPLVLVLALGCGGGAPARTATPPPANTAAPAPATAPPEEPLADDEAYDVVGALIAAGQRLAALANRPCAEITAAIIAETEGNRERFALASRLPPEDRDSAERLLAALHYKAAGGAPTGVGRAGARCDPDPAFTRAIGDLAALIEGYSVRK